MDNELLISTIKEQVINGDIIDIESYAFKNEVSRTKATSVLTSSEWEEIKIRKRSIYIRK